MASEFNLDEFKCALSDDQHFFIDPIPLIKCGHYVCWKKEQNGWLEISDSTSTFHENFLKDLQGVYLLFLEKIEQTP